jgi:hypothetical protein
MWAKMSRYPLLKRAPAQATHLASCMGFFVRGNPSSAIRRMVLEFHESSRIVGVLRSCDDGLQCGGRSAKAVIGQFLRGGTVHQESYLAVPTHR